VRLVSISVTDCYPISIFNSSDAADRIALFAASLTFELETNDIPEQVNDQPYGLHSTDLPLALMLHLEADSDVNTDDPEVDINDKPNFPPHTTEVVLSIQLTTHKREAHDIVASTPNLKTPQSHYLGKWSWPPLVQVSRNSRPKSQPLPPSLTAT
jgi:hypothetical protein